MCVVIFWLSLSIDECWIIITVYNDHQFQHGQQHRSSEWNFKQWHNWKTLQFTQYHQSATKTCPRIFQKVWWTLCISLENYLGLCQFCDIGGGCNGHHLLVLFAFQSQSRHDGLVDAFADCVEFYWNIHFPFQVSSSFNGYIFCAATKIELKNWQWIRFSFFSGFPQLLKFLKNAKKNSYNLLQIFRCAAYKQIISLMYFTYISRILEKILSSLRIGIN